MSYVFNIPFRDNQKLKRVISLVKRDVKLQTLWRCANTMAIDRLGYTDHGPTHVKIVANSALRLLRILIDNKVIPSIVRNYGMKNEDAEVVVVLGSIFHDLGMVVTRDGHELYAQVLRQQFGIGYASRRGVPGRHRDPYHIRGAEGINCDNRHNAGVYAA